MAARHLPIPNVVSAQTITIGTNFEPSPKSCIISGAGPLSITFDNESGASISIQFIAPVYPANQVVFNNVNNLGNQQQNTQAPQVANASVNYNVVANGTTKGPYGIQVGNGPMYVGITNNNSAPDQIAVPQGGTLVMYSNDANTAYNIHWPNTNPFPGLTVANYGVANNNSYTEVGPAQGYAYTFTLKAMLGMGGGTIKIQ